MNGSNDLQPLKVSMLTITPTMWFHSVFNVIYWKFLRILLADTLTKNTSATLTKYLLWIKLIWGTGGVLLRFTMSTDEQNILRWFPLPVVLLRIMLTQWWVKHCEMIPTTCSITWNNANPMMSKTLWDDSHYL